MSREKARDLPAHKSQMHTEAVPTEPLLDLTIDGVLLRAVRALLNQLSGDLGEPICTLGAVLELI